MTKRTIQPYDLEIKVNQAPILFKGARGVKRRTSQRHGFGYTPKLKRLGSEITIESRN